MNAHQQFIERTFNDLAALQGLEGRLSISDTEPISVQFSENTIVSVMTQDEIRERVGLPKLEEEQKVEIEASAHICCKASDSNDDDESVLEYLRNTGSFEHKVVSDKRFNFDSFETAHIREQECLKYWFAELGPIESAILDILVKEPSTPFLSIARSLQISNDRMMAAIQTLNEANAINIVIKEIAGSTQRVVDVTEEGKRIIKDIKPVEEEFGIGYVYDLRPELKGQQPVLIETSRTFCRKLIHQSRPDKWRSEDIQEIGEGYTGKVWTLTEIQNLTMETGRNVWNRGGGWWGESIHCRHEWRQVLITKKAK